MNKKIEEHEIFFHNFILEEEGNKDLKKSGVKGKENFGFVIPFCRKTISAFLNITFLTLFI